MEVNEGNKLIAEFMGLEREYDEYKSGGRWEYLKDGYWLPVQKLKYHTSWDWLMEVVEKISKMPLLNSDGTECTDLVDTCYPITFNMPTDDGLHVMFRFKGFAIYTADTLIEAAWLACVDACKFNTQPF